MIRLESVNKSYAGSAVLRDISFNVESGKSLSIIGPSGCGKTTLLYLMAGLVEATSGDIFLDKKKVIGTNQQTAFILQDYGLLPWKTVSENIALGMKIKKYNDDIIISVSEKIMKDLGIFSHRGKYPATLSGGEKQRVAIARALSTEPEVLLMDEPFSSLDTITREKLQKTVYDIHQSRNLTLVTVTHSIEEAVYLGDSILVMAGSPGRIISEIKNSSRGKMNFRNSKDFLSLCSSIRGMIGNL